MRKPSQWQSASNRYRASGSTDILAGADAAFAVSRLGQDVVVVECVKSQEAEEHKPFVVSLYDTGPESPVRMLFERQHVPAQAEQGEIDRALNLVLDFLSQQQGQCTKTADILAYLSEKGTAARTGERTLTTLEERTRIYSPRRGVKQLVTQAKAA
jgi:hypothetical protein